MSENMKYETMSKEEQIKGLNKCIKFMVKRLIKIWGVYFFSFFIISGIASLWIKYAKTLSFIKSPEKKK